MSSPDEAGIREDTGAVGAKVFEPRRTLPDAVAPVAGLSAGAVIWSAEALSAEIKRVKAKALPPTFSL